MFSPNANEPLAVQIPRPADDRPSWTRVGVITAIGFLVGVTWPRVAGIRLGPSVPETAASVASATGPASPSIATPPSAAPGEVAVVAASATIPAVASSPALPASPPPPPPAPSVAVGRGIVFACRSSEGDSLKGADCGSLSGLDGVVVPRLRKLAECPEAAGASGKVHFVMHLDFPRGGVSIDLGRGHSVAASDALLACAKANIAGLGLTSVSHDNPRYSIAYTVTFGGATSSASASAARPAGEGADETAQVVYEVAIVRDAPKTGKVVARLQRGTELHLGPARDGWYPVKFGDGFASDGWLYRGAIGK
jgi:hypothetical protein